MTSPDSGPPEPADAPTDTPTCAPVVRFAPSPNGYLHMGHALSALIVNGWAKALGARLLLRIEDTDLARCKPHFVEAIYEDLAWLGLAWEEPVLIQSQHVERYGAVLAGLQQRGLAYGAPASRGDIKAQVDQRTADGAEWPTDPDGSPLYPFGPADRAKAGNKVEPDVPLRLDAHAALASLTHATGLAAHSLSSPLAQRETVPVDPLQWGDVLLRGRDRPATYHLAVVIDDAFQGVTHVVRGQDMEAATSIHRLLQEVLGLPAPFYHHHRLILGQDGRKLSKSEGAKSLRALRKSGLSRDGLIEQLLNA